MIKFIATIALIFGLFTFWTKLSPAPLAAQNIDTQDKLVVVELFTSQSCSSCPPADKNLAALSQNPNIIPLAFHVTYWDHLHWKDTLSRPFATQRQRQYARYKNSNRVYTPQMIVNGGEEFIGSRNERIHKSIKSAKPVARITLHQNGENLIATLPRIKDERYTLWLAGVKKIHTQKIPTGENRGKTVDYHNAVLTLQDVGHWNGTTQQRDIKIETEEPDIDHYVLLAQLKSYGAITAVGQSSQIK